MIKLLSKAILCVSCVSMITGCQRESEDLINFIKLSEKSFSFDETGNQTFVVTVESAPQKWQHAKEGDWLNVSDVTDNSITVTGTVNQTAADRYGKIVISNAFSSEEILVHQLAKSQPGVPKFRSLPEFNHFKISQGGKMGLGYAEVAGRVTMINIVTDERTELARVPAGVLHNIGGISDNGEVIIMSSHEGNSVKYVNEHWEPVQIPDGLGIARCTVESVSPDGSIWVGHGITPASPGKNVRYHPVKWVNGIPKVLAVPELNGMKQPVQIGAMARGCSNDGSLIYGSVWDRQEAVMWNAEGKVEYIAKEIQKLDTVELKGFFGPMKVAILSTPIDYANVYMASPSGKYLSAAYRKVVAVNQRLETSVAPMFLNVKTGEYSVLGGAAMDIDGNGGAITDDGLFFYSTPFEGAGQGFVYDINAKVTKPVLEWIKEYYGISVLGKFFVEYVCADKNTVLMRQIAFAAQGVAYVPSYVTTEGVIK